MRAIRGRGPPCPVESHNCVVIESSLMASSDKVLEEFRNNGREVELESSTESADDGRCGDDEDHVRSADEEEAVSKEQRLVKKQRRSFCVFCRKNKEPMEVCMSHNFRSKDGKIACPVLRNYKCPVCGNTDPDKSHTIKYCPFNVGGSRKQSIMDLINNSQNAAFTKKMIKGC